MAITVSNVDVFENLSFVNFFVEYMSRPECQGCTPAHTKHVEMTNGCQQEK